MWFDTKNVTAFIAWFNKALVNTIWYLIVLQEYILLDNSLQAMSEKVICIVGQHIFTKIISRRLV